jgi:hypothetical protein
MADPKKIIDGLTILHGLGAENVDAQHDVIYVDGPDPADQAEIAVDFVARLEELGWWWDEDGECWGRFT